MYNVAFVYTKEAGGYEGIVTWTSYPSKEEFDKMWKEYPEEVRKKERILEEGITPERCIELVEQTPQACHQAAALEELKEILELSLKTSLEEAGFVIIAQNVKM